jgi:dihydroflavonol-4-reductase
MGETVLVTGGTGFVASWCIVELLKRGYTVRTTVRTLSKEPLVRAAIASAVDSGERLSFFAADLTRDEGWDAAVAGCDYVLHVASPLGTGFSRDRNRLIGPARDGSLRVLRAATKAGVKRVVVTSSVSAASPPWRGPDGVNDETAWTALGDKAVDAYPRSKTLAERAAWDFMAAQGAPTTLTTILPSMILGPVLMTEAFGSVQVIQRLLDGSMPGIPRLGFSLVDVRDVADLHIRAMTSPDAAGQRFIAAGDFMWIAEMSSILRATLGARARKVPSRPLPDFALRFLSLFDPRIRLVTPNLGRRRSFTSAKAQRVLGWTPRPAATAVVDCAQSLIAKNTF